jgi:hypothetical protein
MATQIQYRRGTNAQNAAFTGALAEITVDTTNGTLRVHDGITAGGSNIATVSYVTSQISALSSNSISSGTSNVRVFANSNVTTSVGGTANVLNVTSTGAIITGDLSVTGNATLSGNILGDRIQNGTTTIDIQTANGNANISVAGTSNVAVFASTGAFITGLISASGNITGGNISATNHTGTTVSVTGTVTGTTLTGTSLTVTTGNITGGNLLLSGAIIDSAQLDIQTSASNSNIALAPNGTGMVTVSTQVSAVGNITGGNIRTAGLISATGSITGASVVGGVMTGSSLSVTGAINGTTLTGTSLTVSTGNVSCGNIVNTNANGVGNIGSSTTYFNTVFAKATSAQYADLAEMYSADFSYEPGTVVVFGGNHEVEMSTTSHANHVAGVISTNPSYIMNAGQTGLHVVAVALQGRVPTKVKGPVSKGDRMVSSDLPGVAQVLETDKYQPGCIIGKALQAHTPTYDNEGNEIVGIIEVVVGRV